MTSPELLTPMLRHYLEVKAQHPDALLFYRMGDFFELFFEDAEQAAPLLEVTLTARNKASEKAVPMCGVPHHALDGYLGKVLRAGRKVAICDQTEDPAQAKGLVRREVTRVITPGTVSQPELLDGKEENLLAALVWQGEEGAGAFLDVSTGAFFLRRFRSASVSAGETARSAEEICVEDLGVYRPRELLYEPGNLPAAVQKFADTEVACRTSLEGDRFFDRDRAAELLRGHFGASTLRGFGLEDGEPGVVAAAAALAYAKTTQFSDLRHVETLALREGHEAMVIDATTLANLEIFRNQREGGKKATLLSVLDRTLTPAGGRLLRDWLRRPLRDPERIADRHDAVAELLQKPAIREELRAALEQVGDPERLLSRAVLGTLTPREAGALRDGLRRLPSILSAVGPCLAAELRQVAALDPLDDLAYELERTLVEAPPATLKNGGVIAEGLDEELDRSRSLARDSKGHILALEIREQKATGIPSLKIRYNRVFGYYLEITNANQHLVPAHYLRKQTLVGAERYATPEIKDLEEQILNAEEKQLQLEQSFYDALVRRIAAEGAPLRAMAAGLARLDVYCSFAEQAAKRRYCRPVLLPAGEDLEIREGRHPVVEATGGDPFVPNDTDLGRSARIVVLTGPNMGGKSTYLRQVALIVLMAQAGSFVPAESVRLGVVDRIFTRVGASDDLARGESTFMVEMIETANILHHASADSLVILDEVGRGTATFDGMSLAWAIVEYLQQTRCPKTLFATHYHELTELAGLLKGVVNRTMAVKEWQDKIVFLRRVVQGAADKSYGLHVARLAGLPSKVIERATEVLANLEKQEYDPHGRPRRAAGKESPPPEPGSQQLSLFTPPEQMVAQILVETDLNALTPLAALNLLHSLRSRLRG
jgi:DNA mismatch repair protein MutS